MKRWALTSLVLVLCVGCGDGDGDGDGSGSINTAGDVGDVGDGDGDGDGEADGDGDGEGGDGDGDGDPPKFNPFDEADWARGDIKIDKVEVNQGTAIQIVSGGQLIPVEGRTGGLVKDRDTLIQAYWSTPGGWTPRPILAKLHLRAGNGALDVLEVTQTISGPPTAGSLTGPITWQVPGGGFTGDTEFFIELWEGEPGHDGIAASAQAPSAPAGGMQPIGVTTEPMEMKLIMVPVKYNSGGNCNTDTAAVLQSNVNAFANYFVTQNPIHTLDIRIHETGVLQAEKITTLSEINNSLVTLRFNDFAEPNEYYFALINVCGGGVDGAAGVAPGTPAPTKGVADDRVSTGVWTSLNSAMGTFIHEVGHTQGRPHAPCGNPDGVDPDYPHSGAAIGAWGFNIQTGQWKNPNTNVDYMSYCGPTWVSDYTWGQVHEQTRLLTSWDYEGPDDGGEETMEILHGWVHPSGLQGWWTSPGAIPPEMLTVAEAIAFHDADGVLIDEVPAASYLADDGKTRYFMAEVPDSSLDLVDDIVRISKDRETLVPRHEVRRHFDAR